MMGGRGCLLHLCRLRFVESCNFSFLEEHFFQRKKNLHAVAVRDARARRGRLRVEGGLEKKGTNFRRKLFAF